MIKNESRLWKLPECNWRSMGFNKLRIHIERGRVKHLVLVRDNMLSEVD